MLAKTAGEKYDVDIKPSQIAHLILSRFECSLPLYDHGVKYMLKGEVSDFRSHPLRIDFFAPEGSKERALFENRLLLTRGRRKKGTNLRFTCEMDSMGRVVRANYLRISNKQVQELGLVDELLGPANASYVTRHQITKLASRIYSDLNIVEEYEIPENTFSDLFTDELLRQAVAAQYTYIPIEEALGQMSGFSANIGKDLQATEIIEDLGSILEIANVNNKSHIVVNEDNFNSLKEKGKADYSGDGKGSFLGVINVGASVKAVQDNSRDWQEANRSLNDQMRTLNQEAQSDIKWVIKGSQIIPKSIRVNKVSRSSFDKTLSFQRVRKQFFAAPFSRRTAMYTYRAEQPESLFEQMQKVVASLKSNDVDIAGKVFENQASLQKLRDQQDGLREEFQEATQNAVSERVKLQGGADVVLARVESLEAAVEVLNKTALKRCKICFHESEGSSQCQGSRSSCSGWGGSWTGQFRDDTDTRPGGCLYMWRVVCEA